MPSYFELALVVCEKEEEETSSYVALSKIDRQLQQFHQVLPLRRRLLYLGRVRSHQKPTAQ